MKSLSRIFSMMVIAATMSLPALASESGTFTIDSGATQSIQLSGTQVHDVYREVLIQRTCSREVLSHYRTVCRDVPSEVCWTEPGGARQCKAATRRECHKVAQYRTEFYDCSYWTTVKVGTEIDYYVNATIEVKAELPEGATAREIVRASIHRYSGTVDFTAASTTGQFLVFLDHSTETQIEGMQKNIHIKATAKLVPAAEIRNAFRAGIKEVDLNAGALTFEMASHLFSKEIDVELKIGRQRKLWFAKKVFSGDVAASALEISEGADKTRYSVDLAKLGLKESLKGEKEYKIQMKVQLSSSILRNCLNKEDLGKHGSAEIKLKKQKL